jgi:hypothetical protein
MKHADDTRDADFCFSETMVVIEETVEVVGDWDPSKTINNPKNGKHKRQAPNGCGWRHEAILETIGAKYQDCRR